MTKPLGIIISSHSGRLKYVKSQQNACDPSTNPKARRCSVAKGKSLDFGPLIY